MMRRDCAGFFMLTRQTQARCRRLCLHAGPTIHHTSMRLSIPFSFILATAVLGAEDKQQRLAGTVILNETGVKNLKLETVEVEEGVFEETIFALGRIEPIPVNVSAISSRIAGRIVELNVQIGDTVKPGDEVARVESRQPGDPPPVISLKATHGGLVTSSHIKRGDPVEPEKSLLEVTDLANVYAVAHVPEHLAGKLKPGAVAHIRVSALPDEKFDGELLRFGTAADRASGTLDAVFKLTNPGLSLRPDMRAEFSIVMSQRENVMSVPRLALQGDAADRFVYVKDFDLPNAFVKTPIIVGAINDQRVEVASGLLPGDEVVTRGAYSLAYAGKGSVSLKEALDAAHGHEHNEDGTEVTAAQKQAHGHDDHDHDHAEGGGSSGTLALISYAMNAVLLVLLVLATFKRKEAA